MLVKTRRIQALKQLKTSLFCFSQFNQNAISQVQAKKGFKYYRPSERKKLFLRQRFDFRFEEIQNSLVTKGFFSKLRIFYKWRTQYPNLSTPQNQQQLCESLPINQIPDFTCAYNKIKCTWIGHSTAVLSIGGKTNLLIDPVWSERCSPFKLFGPKRYMKTPYRISQLPKIDIVLVSHDHYDHMDQRALHQLEQSFNPVFLAGLNSKNVFHGKSTVHQLDWTQTLKIIVDKEEFQITFVPVCHWSRRGLFDLGKRLWGGFVIKTPKGKLIFYSGDTGYCDVFKEIHEVFGDFDLCILPIGVYEPRQFLKNQHTNPDQAVIIHKQLKSKKSVGVHWGTFPLSSQRWDSPRQKLKQACLKHGLKDNQFVTVNHGDSFEIEY